MSSSSLQHPFLSSILGRLEIEYHCFHRGGEYYPGGLVETIALNASYKFIKRYIIQNSSMNGLFVSLILKSQNLFKSCKQAS
jgi:hypothetical protein